MEQELKSKVMIVDDDETVVFPIKVSLLERGIETITFTDPEAALEYLKHNKVNVILLDYHMEPHINGDEFIKRLREFDNETIVYLHTAYSEELPAIDMLEKYQIQGYIDKGKVAEERMQLILSAINQAKIISLVKEQEATIDAHTYKEEFIGRFFDMIFGEVKEKAFIQNTTIEALKSMDNRSSEEFNSMLDNLKKQVSEVNEILGSLDINYEVITTTQLKEKLERLLLTLCKAKNVTLNIEARENKFLKCDSRNIIYILTEAISYLMKTSVSVINIIMASVGDDLVIAIKHSIDENEINRLKKLAKFDEKIELKVTDSNELEVIC